MLTKFKEWLIHWLLQENHSQEFPLSDFERIRYEVRPCDVLLIEGHGRVSEVIKQITQSPWSHACLYLGRLHDIDSSEQQTLLKEYFKGEPNEQLIIESYLGKGTIAVNLEHYRNAHIRICRPRGLSRPDAQAIIGYALSRLGSDYDVRQILDLWRFMLPLTILPRRWRSSLFTSTHSSSARTVCSTMIAEAFHGVNFPILPIIKRHEETGIALTKRNPRLYTPSDFDYSPYFEIIKYPFITFNDYGLYRDLPWDERSSLTPQAPLDTVDGQLPNKDKPNQARLDLAPISKQVKLDAKENKRDDDS